MRVLMLDNEFPPLGGGMGTVNQALFRVYAQRDDLEIDLITSALGGRFEVERFAEAIRIYKVPVWNGNIHHSTGRELVTYAAQALPLARNFHRARPYDLCLAWSALPAGAVALALRQLLGLPYVVWVSGPDIPGFERRYRTLYPLLTPLIRATWRGAGKVIAKCAEEIAMIRAIDPSVSPVLIPNGVDLDAFRPGAPIPDDGPLRVICVARLIERKGQQHLIAAVRMLADEGLDVRLELVGTGDALESLRRQARALGVEDRVSFAGYVPREAIGGRFAAAHVFALPSYNEGLALAGLEALAAGMPLVLSRTGGTADLVEEGVNGLTHGWADVEALAGHLRRLASDRALARRMGAASRERAKRFGWPAIARQFLDLMVEVGGSRSRSRYSPERSDPLHT
ncbi:MAG TPA: glycosyltransferase family 4 protein [Roseiflexaceae bacterium]|nr:glycosyltransferase family 4 protein [Roseiflexaceae bacterium]